MRKLILPTLTLVFILALVACNASDNGSNGYDPQPTYTAAPTAVNQDTNTNETTPPEVDPTPETPAPQGFTFTTQGVTIHMDQNMEEVLDQLGEPLGIFEAPSCAFDGIDRIFSFPGVQIHTYPLDDLDFVHTISIRDDSVTTANGIYLGSSWNDVLAAYGSEYDQDFGMFRFTIGQTTLSFFIEDDMVTGILYELIMG